MVTAFCRAKDPKTCKYHGTQMLMLQAQSDGKFDDYLKYRGLLEDLEKLGDLEATNWQTPNARQELYADINFQPASAPQQPTSAAPDRQIAEGARPTVEAGRIPLTSEEFMQHNNHLFDVVEAPVNLVNAQGKPTGRSKPVKFYLHKEGVTPVEPSYIRVQTNKALSTEDVRLLSGMLGYSYRIKIGGARLGSAQHDTPFSFIVQADTSLANEKSSGENLPEALNALEEQFQEYINDGGTPLRKKDNQRAVTRNNGKDIQFRFFYDSVAIDVNQKA